MIDLNGKERKEKGKGRNEKKKKTIE